MQLAWHYLAFKKIAALLLKLLWYTQSHIHHKCLIHEVLRHTFASACSRAAVRKQPCDLIGSQPTSLLHVLWKYQLLATAWWLLRSSGRQNMQNNQKHTAHQSIYSKKAKSLSRHSPTHERKASKGNRRLFLKAKRAAKEKNRTRREQPTILVGEKIVKMRKKTTIPGRANSPTKVRYQKK